MLYIFKSVIYSWNLRHVCSVLHFFNEWQMATWIIWMQTLMTPGPFNCYFQLAASLLEHGVEFRGYCSVCQFRGTGIATVDTIATARGWCACARGFLFLLMHAHRLVSEITSPTGPNMNMQVQVPPWYLAPCLLGAFLHRRVPVHGTCGTVDVAGTEAEAAPASAPGFWSSESRRSGHVTPHLATARCNYTHTHSAQFEHSTHIKPQPQQPQSQSATRVCNYKRTQAQAEFGAQLTLAWTRAFKHAANNQAGYLNRNSRNLHVENRWLRFTQPRLDVSLRFGGEGASRSWVFACLTLILRVAGTLCCSLSRTGLD